MAAPALPADAHECRVEFTGDAAAYRRLWAANLLRTLLTLGLFAPVARRRGAAYLRAHTLLAGSPLEFTPPPRRGAALVVLLFIGYLAFRTAAQGGQDTLATALLLAGTVLAPFAWGSLLRLRLGAIGWRGLRPRFAAGWSDVYRASWPLFATALAWGTVFLLPAVWRTAAPALALLVTVPCMLRLEFNYKTLAVARTRVGTLPLHWQPSFGAFLRIWLGTAGVFLLTLAVLGPLLAWPLRAALARLPGAQEMGEGAVPVAIALGVGTLVLVMLATAPARAYREACLFRLLWGGLAVGEARFRCDLSVRRYVALRVKHALLSVATLGVSRPFAHLAEHHMKAQSVRLCIAGGREALERLVEQASA